MPDLDNESDPHKQTLMGHLRLLPKIIFFSMLAYGFVRLLVWITKSFEGKF